jgi:type II secretory pathway component PulC
MAKHRNAPVAVEVEEARIARIGRGLIPINRHTRRGLMDEERVFCGKCRFYRRAGGRKMNNRILHVADDRVMFATQGIRAVKKVTYQSRGEKARQSLEVDYKGMTETVGYGSNEGARDAMYDALVDAMPKCQRIRTSTEE